jgi:hypothetical protein
MKTLEFENESLTCELDRLRSEKMTFKKKINAIEIELADKLRCISFLLVKIRTNVLEKMQKHIHDKIVDNIKNVIVKKIEAFIL